MLGIPALGHASFTGRAFMVLAVAVAMATAPQAHAGRSCEPRKTTPQLVERGMKLAEQTAAALDS